MLYSKFPERFFMKGRKFMRGRRIVFYSTCIALMLMTNGCVYVRLLKVKKQLYEFDQYLHLNEQENLLTFLQPLLLPQDIIWLMKTEPTVQIDDDEFLFWQYIFKKQHPEALYQDEKGDVDIIVTMNFKNGKLQQFGLPKQLSSKLLPGLLRLVGENKVDTRQRNITIQWKDQQLLQMASIPTRKNIEKTLGKPSIVKQINSETILSYQYDLQPHGYDNVSSSQVLFVFRCFGEELVEAKVLFNEMSVELIM